MKHVALLAAGSIIAVAVLAVALIWPCGESPASIRSQGPTRDRLEQLAQLVTIRVYIADVLTADGNGYRGAWLIKGDAVIGVDLRHAKITHKDTALHRAVICLPQPQVLQSRVDHEHTWTWEVRRTSWMPWGGNPDHLRDDVMRQAQRLVAHAAGSSENMAQARSAATAVLCSFYEEVGWQVQIAWQSAGAAN